MLLYISVPDKIVHNRRNVLFLKTLVDNKEDTNENNKDKDSVAESLDKLKIGETEYCLQDLSMSTLMDLSLEDLRLLDSKVGLLDGNS